MGHGEVTALRGVSKNESLDRCCHKDHSPADQQGLCGKNAKCFAIFFSPRKADIRIGDSTEHCPIHYDSGLLSTFSEPKQNSVCPPREVKIM